MTSRRSKSQEPEKIPTQLLVSKEYFKEDLIERVRLGEEMKNRIIHTEEQLVEARRDFYDWDDYNSELLKQSFNNEINEYKEDYDDVNRYYNFFGPSSKPPIVEFQEKLDNKLINLRQLIAKVNLMKSSSPSVTAESVRATSDSSAHKQIFIVHGHNNEVKIDVARTLEKLGLNPIVLHEQPNVGRTIIEKFEEHSNVGFAIVLLTNDDLGSSGMDGDLKARARQNVILELGYFIGKLGRRRVCPLYVKGVELPSDLHGMLYVEFDDPGHWRIKLAKELKAAGYDIDVNRII